MELSAIYTIISPDGKTRAVFNDPLDVDFVGYLTGIQGLDSPEVRESAYDLPSRDGGHNNEFFYGRRPIVLEGIIDVSGGLAGINARSHRLITATNALGSPCQLVWAETGSGAALKMVRANRSGALRIVPGRPRTFTVYLNAPDPRIYDFNETSWGITSEQDATLTLPLYNQGTCDTPWTCRIFGPINEPVLTKTETGEQVKLTGDGGLNLTAGQFLDLDFENHTAKLGGTTNKYRHIAIPDSVWFWLTPTQPDGTTNTVQLTSGAVGATGITDETGFEATYRPAWI